MGEMVKMTLKDKLLIYINRKNNEIELENEIIYSMKFHKMDSLDHYEVMRRIVYNHAWQTFINDLYKIILGTHNPNIQSKDED